MAPDERRALPCSATSRASSRSAARFPPRKRMLRCLGRYRSSRPMYTRSSPRCPPTPVLPFDASTPPWLRSFFFLLLLELWGQVEGKRISRHQLDGPAIRLAGLFGGDDGTRTHAPCLQSRCSSQLSYVPDAPPADTAGDHRLGVRLTSGGGVGLRPKPCHCELPKASSARSPPSGRKSESEADDLVAAGRCHRSNLRCSSDGPHVGPGRYDRARRGGGPKRRVRSPISPWWGPRVLTPFFGLGPPK